MSGVPEERPLDDVNGGVPLRGVQVLVHRHGQPVLADVVQQHPVDGRRVHAVTDFGGVLPHDRPVVVLVDQHGRLEPGGGLAGGLGDGDRDLQRHTRRVLVGHVPGDGRDLAQLQQLRRHVLHVKQEPGQELGHPLVGPGWDVLGCVLVGVVVRAAGEGREALHPRGVEGLEVRRDQPTLDRADEGCGDRGAHVPGLGQRRGDDRVHAGAERAEDEVDQRGIQLGVAELRGRRRHLEVLVDDDVGDQVGVVADPVVAAHQPHLLGVPRAEHHGVGRVDVGQGLDHLQHRADGGAVVDRAVEPRVVVTPDHHDPVGVGGADLGAQHVHADRVVGLGLHGEAHPQGPLLREGLQVRPVVGPHGDGGDGGVGVLGEAHGTDLDEVVGGARDVEHRHAALGQDLVELGGAVERGVPVDHDDLPVGIHTRVVLCPSGPDVDDVALDRAGPAIGEGGRAGHVTGGGLRREDRGCGGLEELGDVVGHGRVSGFAGLLAAEVSAPLGLPDHRGDVVLGDGGGGEEEADGEDAREQAGGEDERTHGMGLRRVDER